MQYACVRERGVYNFTASYYQEPHIFKLREKREREKNRDKSTCKLNIDDLSEAFLETTKD